MRTSAALALLILMFGCDGGPSGDGGTDDGTTPTGDPKIIEFVAASSAVPLGETVELRWKVENAKAVTIFSSTEILVTTPMQEGVVTTLPIQKLTTFTLRATGSGPAVGHTVDVTATWPEPRINSFTVDPEVTVQQSLVTLRWETENAEAVTILANDVPIPGGMFMRQAAKAYSFPAIVTTATTTFTLRVTNPTYEIEDDVVVLATPPPQFTRFTATPRTFVESSTVVTVTWESTGFDQVELQANYYPVPGFPRDLLNGSWEVTVEFNTDITMLGYVGGVPYTQVWRQVTRPAIEFEPNDDPTFPQYISYEGGVIATMQSTTDVDYFVIDVYEVSDLRIWVRGEQPGCPVDTSIELLYGFREPGGEPIGTDEDDGIPTGRGGACAEIDPERDEFARAVFGTFIIGVRSERGETGNYVLMTETTPPR